MSTRSNLDLLKSYLYILLSLLHNDLRTQPLEPMALWDRRLNSLFPILPLLTFLYVIVFCRLVKKNYMSNLQKTAFFLIPTCLAASPQLQKVVRSTYQRPLTLASLNSSPHKPVKTANILNLSKHRLDRFTSNLIQFSATLS